MDVDASSIYICMYASSILTNTSFLLNVFVLCAISLVKVWYITQNDDDDDNVFFFHHISLFPFKSTIKFFL